MLPRILITGGSGFVGRHLVAYLRGRAASVAVLGAGPSQAPAEVHIYEADIRHANVVHEAIHDFKPSHVCHLAAISSVAQSWSAPRLTYEVNVLGTFNVLEAAMSLPEPAKILNVSTAQVYAASPDPLCESSPLAPENPYAASKAMAELFAVQYGKASKGGGVVTARSFNHAGPGQAPDYVLSSIAKQFAEIEAGLREPRLSVGNTHVQRDFTDVRDVVEAYFQLLMDGKTGEVYNVCSGRATSIDEVIGHFEELANVKVQVESHEGRRRPGEVQVSCGNRQKIRSETGWEPKIPLRKTLQDILDYWRTEIGRSARSMDLATHEPNGVPSPVEVK